MFPIADKLDGRWNANIIEFKSDVNKEYDWVYLVASHGYTKFNKEENVASQLSNCTPYEAILDGGNGKLRNVRVIGKERWLFEDFDRLIVVEDNVISCGVHPSCVYANDNK